MVNRQGYWMRRLYRWAHGFGLTASMHWLVRACAALVLSYLDPTPDYPHFTDEKAHMGEGHVPGHAAEPCL